MKREMGLLLVVVVLPLGLLVAADGATPIWEPTTITEPGRYVLTRSISGASGDVITVDADHVELDLNGMTIEVLDENGAAVVNTCEPGPTPCGDVSVRNGRITGTGNGIHLQGLDIEIHDMVVQVTKTGIFVETAFGVIRDNTVTGGETGILCDCGSTVIRNNSVGITSVSGIEVTDGDGAEITHNTVSSDGIGIDSESYDGVIANNVVTWCVGDGIRLSHARNRIENNVSNGNGGYGLHLIDSTEDNLFRGNSARGNFGTGCTGAASGGEFCDEGTDNTSHGDNYLPGQM